MVDYKYKFLVEEDHSTDIYHSFIDLWDTPSNYTGSQRYVVVVTPTESGVQFTNKLSNIGFDTTVSGVDPISPYDLTTKGYVDTYISVAKGISISCGSENIAHMEYTTSSWVLGRRFIFSGTDLLGTPSNIKFICKVHSENDAGYLRIYDDTNNKEICVIYVDGNDTWHIASTAGSNFPQTESIFSIQGKTVQGGTKIYLSTVSIVF